MKDILKQFLNQFVTLKEEEFLEVAKLVKLASLKKREIVFREGETSDKLIFFFNGYFRFYHYQNENEVTSDFYFAPNIVTSYTSLISGKPSKVFVQAMENMDVLILYKNNLEELYKKFHNIDRLGRKVAEKVAINSEQHLFSLLNQTAEERYKNLLEINPKFVNTIPLQYIASYLGITKETLSRIRKNLQQFF